MKRRMLGSAISVLVLALMAGGSVRAAESTPSTPPSKRYILPCGRPRMLIVTASELTNDLRCGDRLWRFVLSLATISPSTFS